LSEANGGLDEDNLASAFRIRDYHIRPEEAIRVRSDFTRVSVDYFSENESGADVDDTDTKASLVNVAGCGLRFHVPYQADVLWNVGFFVNIFRLHIGSDNDEQDATDTLVGNVRYQLSLSESGGNPTALTHTRRRLPVSVSLNPNPADASLGVHEMVCSFYIDLNHFSRDLAAGWHDIQLRLQLSDPSGGTTETVLRSSSSNETALRTSRLEHAVHTRVTFGIRNPVAITFHS
jgi:hypothetical protein